MAHYGAKNNMKSFLFGGHFLWSFFGYVWENSGKNPSHPEKIACSFTYVLHHHRFRDFELN